MKQQTTMLLESLNSMYHNVLILEALCDEKEVQGNTKYIFRQIINRENANIRDIVLRLPQERMELFNKDIINIDGILAFANVRHLFYGLDKEGQDKVEDFITNLYNEKQNLTNEIS